MLANFFTGFSENEANSRVVVHHLTASAAYTALRVPKNPRSDVADYDWIVEGETAMLISALCKR
jgi:hypothetical protein